MRLQAAQMFAQGMNAGQIAGLLRVSAKSVYQWRRPGGQAGRDTTRRLVSRNPWRDVGYAGVRGRDQG